MVRMPETRVGMVAAALGVLVVVGVVLPLAFIGGLTLAFSSGPGFPADGGPVMIHGPVTAATVYADVAEVADGDDRRGAGAQYRCRLVAVSRGEVRRTRGYRCVVPGHGAGDLGYRVTVRASSACWRARGAAPALRGCIRTEYDAGGWD